MAATIRDVARVAGVSPSTVSRVFTRPDAVNEATRATVLDVAHRLAYVPNRAARGLITGRTGNLGVIVPDLTNPFFPGLVKSVQARAEQADYAVLLADSDEDGANELRLIRALSRQVDGIVLCAPRAGEAELRDVAGVTQLVLCNRRLDGIPSITFDNADGMQQAVSHLRALRHRRLAWVGGPKTSWSTKERLRGLQFAVSAAGLELEIIGSFPPNFDGGVAAADLVVASGATAVVAYNDLIALGLISRLRDRGVDVPRDLSVVGVDDIPMSGMFTPALTTVALPQEQAGRAAVDLLLSLVNQPGAVAGGRLELPAQLVVRDSTAVAPSG